MRVAGHAAEAGFLRCIRSLETHNTNITYSNDNGMLTFVWGCGTFPFARVCFGAFPFARVCFGAFPFMPCAYNTETNGVLLYLRVVCCGTCIIIYLYQEHPESVSSSASVILHNMYM